MGEAIRASDGRLVLLVDYDVDSRRQARHLLELRGMEVVQASNGMAALELIQRLPRSFRLVLTDLDLPGIPGPVVVETLRIFRPDLPVLCMSATRTVAGRVEVKRCLSKPLQGGELEAMLEESASGWGWRGCSGFRMSSPRGSAPASRWRETWWRRRSSSIEVRTWANEG